jgi:hypothetical protein
MGSVVDVSEVAAGRVSWTLMAALLLALAITYVNLQTDVLNWK